MDPTIASFLEVLRERYTHDETLMAMHDSIMDAYAGMGPNVLTRIIEGDFDGQLKAIVATCKMRLQGKKSLLLPGTLVEIVHSSERHIHRRWIGCFGIVTSTLSAQRTMVRVLDGYRYRDSVQRFWNSNLRVRRPPAAE